MQVDMCIAAERTISIVKLLCLIDIRDTQQSDPTVHNMQQNIF